MEELASTGTSADICMQKEATDKKSKAAFTFDFFTSALPASFSERTVHTETGVLVVPLSQVVALVVVVTQVEAAELTDQLKVSVVAVSDAVDWWPSCGWRWNVHPILKRKQFDVHCTVIVYRLSAKTNWYHSAHTY